MVYKSREILHIGLIILLGFVLFIILLVQLRENHQQGIRTLTYPEQLFWRPIESIKEDIFFTLGWTTIEPYIELPVSSKRKEVSVAKLMEKEPYYDEKISYLENGLYINTYFKFQLNLPKDWKYSEFKGSHEPVFIFFKHGAGSPFEELRNPSHFTEGTFVLVAPRGISMDGLPGKTRWSELKFLEGVNDSGDYALQNGQIWNTIATFSAPPLSWKPEGFILGKNEIFGKELICMDGNTRKSEGECDLWHNSISYKGNINSSERQQVESILSSFKFINGAIFSDMSEPFKDMKFSEVSKWKSYKNEEIGIELKYPPELYLGNWNELVVFDYYSPDSIWQKHEGSILAELRVTRKKVYIDDYINERLDEGLIEAAVGFEYINGQRVEVLTYLDAFAGGKHYEYYFSAPGKEVVIVSFAGDIPLESTFKEVTRTLKLSK